jgi:stearoyl-CoA desaturase (Delta-9 desaturase)
MNPLERGARPHTRADHTLPARRFTSRQRKHFAFSVVAPTALSVVLPVLAPELVFMDWFTGAATLLITWSLVGGFGISVGFHRLFSHRSFHASPLCRMALGILGCMAAQGSTTYWVSLHRMHHARSDKPGDPHSPQPAAHTQATAWPFFQGHLGWVIRHDVPAPSRYARDLIADPLIGRVDRFYVLWVLLGVFLPGLVLAGVLRNAGYFFVGAFWGGILRIALGHHIIWAINSWCHTAPNRNADTGDHSRNVIWISLISFGESWHRNHHLNPTSPKFSRKQFLQPDIGWWMLGLLRVLGMAKIK